MGDGESAKDFGEQDIQDRRNRRRDRFRMLSGKAELDGGCQESWVRYQRGLQLEDESSANDARSSPKSGPLTARAVATMLSCDLPET